MPFAGVVAGGLGAIGSVVGGLLGKSAAEKAADQQAQSAKAALDFQKEVYGGQQQNVAPFRAAGETSLAALMDGLAHGSFGFGTVPLPQGFHVPTLEEAQQTPGYEFTQQQGNKGILQGASAAGGAITGGTLKALDKFNSGLADTTYGDVFNRALSTYNAGLQSYQAQLAGQGQAYNQLFGVANLGESAATGLNNTGTAVAGNVGNLMTGIGSDQASGTIGSASALAGGIGGATKSIGSAWLLGNLFNPAQQSQPQQPVYNPFAPGQNGDYNPSTYGMGPG